MKKLLCIAYVFILSACSFEKNMQDVSSDTVYVVLLAGQSNMEGAGSYQALDDSTKQRVNKVSDRVLMSNKGGNPVPLSYTHSPHKLEKYGFDQAFGPELLLGLSLAEQYPSRKFLFIKTAYGGTSLYGAWNSDWTKEKAQRAEKGFKTDLPLFNMFSQYVKEQLSLLTAKNIPYKVVGMMWMQGENDAAKDFSAKSYNDNLIEFIKQNRSLVNEPRMPFIIGQINSTYGRFKDGPKLVRQSMVNVANADEFVDVILTTTDRSWHDFPKHTDNTHYNTEGQVRLGKAFASFLVSYLD